MKNLFKKAHEMTREMVEKYGDVDYNVQFTLCLEYVMEQEEERAAEVMQRLADRPRPNGPYVFGLTRKQVGVIFSNYKRGNLNINEKEISYLYNNVADKKYSVLGLNTKTRDTFDRLRDALELVFAGCYHTAAKEIRIACN